MGIFLRLVSVVAILQVFFWLLGLEPMTDDPIQFLLTISLAKVGAIIAARDFVSKQY